MQYCAMCYKKPAAEGENMCQDCIDAVEELEDNCGYCNLCLNYRDIDCPALKNISPVKPTTSNYILYRAEKRTSDK
jgi:hypothetical protein